VRFVTKKLIRYAGELSCLRKAIETDNVILFWYLIRNLNRCKENEMSVENLIGFQFVRKVIIGIILIM